MSRNAWLIENAKQTSQSSGTGTLTLDAQAVDSFDTWVAAAQKYNVLHSLGNSGGPWTVLYAIKSGAEFEMGYGTLTSGASDTLARADADVINSTNGNNRVDFPPGGQLSVYCPFTAFALGELARIGEGIVCKSDDDITFINRLLQAGSWIAVTNPTGKAGDIILVDDGIVRVAAAGGSVGVNPTSGDAGKVPMVQSDHTKGFQLASLNSGIQNQLLNGNMRHDQRKAGADHVNPNGAYTLDRWRFTQGTGGAATVSRENVDQADLDELPAACRHYLNWNQTSQVTSGIAVLDQPLPDVRTLQNREVTVSFWARVTAGSQSYACQLKQFFGTGGSADVDKLVDNFSIDTTWTRYSGTVTLDSVEGETIGTGDTYLSLRFELGTGVTPTLQITGVRLEEGPGATEVNALPFAVEQAELERFYQKSEDWDTDPAATFSAIANSYTTDTRVERQPLWSAGGLRYPTVDFRVRMRTAPAVTVYDHLGASGVFSNDTGGGRSVGSLVSREGGFQFSTNPNFSDHIAFNWSAEAEITT